MRTLAETESKRLELQASLDNLKTTEERRRLGQFATPSPLAREIAHYAVELLQHQQDIYFLEPSIGTGAFYSALLSELLSSKSLKSATGFEIDKDVLETAQSLWPDGIELKYQDFTKASPDSSKINLLLANPPYVRHHLIDAQDKLFLKDSVSKELGYKISGLSGLYCYFVLLADKWLAEDAVSAWLIPSEFMDVNYGTTLKRYLLEKVQLLRIHWYEPNNPLFEDALVSSCVVWFKKTKPTNQSVIEFSYGGTHKDPHSSQLVSYRSLSWQNKWTPIFHNNTQFTFNEPVLGDFFTIKRGIATGDNSFFIVTREFIEENDLGFENFKPIIPSPRSLSVEYIKSDEKGWPMLPKQHFVLSTTQTETDIKKTYPNLWNYLESSKSRLLQKYICKNRKLWYAQEIREPAPLLCTYMGRGTTKSPFHFILNQSKAVATNSYLMLYPKFDISQYELETLERIWEYLNSISVNDFEREGRIYGGGLRKIEPAELAKIPCRKLEQYINRQQTKQSECRQLSLF